MFYKWKALSRYDIKAPVLCRIKQIFNMSRVHSLSFMLHQGSSQWHVDMAVVCAAGENSQMSVVSFIDDPEHTHYQLWIKHKGHPVEYRIPTHTAYTLVGEGRSAEHKFTTKAMKYTIRVGGYIT